MWGPNDGRAQAEVEAQAEAQAGPGPGSVPGAGAGAGPDAAAVNGAASGGGIEQKVAPVPREQLLVPLDRLSRPKRTKVAFGKALQVWGKLYADEKGRQMTMVPSTRILSQRQSAVYGWARRGL